MLLSEDIVKLGISEFTELGGMTPSEVGPRLSGRPWLPEYDTKKGDAIMILAKFLIGKNEISILWYVFLKYIQLSLCKHVNWVYILNGSKDFLLHKKHTIFCSHIKTTD